MYSYRGRRHITYTAVIPVLLLYDILLLYSWAGMHVSSEQQVTAAARGHAYVCMNIQSTTAEFKVERMDEILLNDNMIITCGRAISTFKIPASTQY